MVIWKYIRYANDIVDIAQTAYYIYDWAKHHNKNKIAQKIEYNKHLSHLLQLYHNAESWSKKKHYWRMYKKLLAKYNAYGHRNHFRLSKHYSHYHKHRHNYKTYYAWRYAVKHQLV